MAQVKVITNVQHDGVLYTENQVISDLTDEQAQALVDGNVATNATDKDVAVAKALAENGDAPERIESKRVDANAKEAERVAAENKAKAPSLDWSRSKLVAFAENLGLDVKDLPNKQAVLDAIEATDKE